MPRRASPGDRSRRTLWTTQSLWTGFRGTAGHGTASRGTPSGPAEVLHRQRFVHLDGAAGREHRARPGQLRGELEGVRLDDRVSGQPGGRRAGRPVGLHRGGRAERVPTVEDGRSQRSEPCAPGLHGGFLRLGSVGHPGALVGEHVLAHGAAPVVRAGGPGWYPRDERHRPDRHPLSRNLVVRDPGLPSSDGHAPDWPLRRGVVRGVDDAHRLLEAGQPLLRCRHGLRGARAVLRFIRAVHRGHRVGVLRARSTEAVALASLSTVGVTGDLGAGPVVGDDRDVQALVADRRGQDHAAEVADGRIVAPIDDHRVGRSPRAVRDRHPRGCLRHGAADHVRGSDGQSRAAPAEHRDAVTPRSGERRTTTAGHHPFLMAIDDERLAAHRRTTGLFRHRQQPTHRVLPAFDDHAVTRRAATVEQRGRGDVSSLLPERLEPVRIGGDQVGLDRGGDRRRRPSRDSVARWAEPAISLRCVALPAGLGGHGRVPEVRHLVGRRAAVVGRDRHRLRAVGIRQPDDLAELLVGNDRGRRELEELGRQRVRRHGGRPAGHERRSSRRGEHLLLGQAPPDDEAVVSVFGVVDRSGDVDQIAGLLQSRVQHPRACQTEAGYAASVAERVAVLVAMHTNCERRTVIGRGTGRKVQRLHHRRHPIGRLDRHFGDGPTRRELRHDERTVGDRHRADLGDRLKRGIVAAPAGGHQSDDDCQHAGRPAPDPALHAPESRTVSCKPDVVCGLRGLHRTIRPADRAGRRPQRADEQTTVVEGVQDRGGYRGISMQPARALDDEVQRAECKVPEHRCRVVTRSDVHDHVARRVRARPPERDVRGHCVLVVDGRHHALRVQCQVRPGPGRLVRTVAGDRVVLAARDQQLGVREERAPPVVVAPRHHPDAVDVRRDDGVDGLAGSRPPRARSQTLPGARTRPARSGGCRRPPARGRRRSAGRPTR